jgi:hypothetical protein
MRRVSHAAVLFRTDLVPWSQARSSFTNAAQPLGVVLHDQIIVGKDGCASLSGLKLI